MDWIVELSKNFPWLYYGYIFIIGLMVGSFLNVVIYRLPIMLEKGFKRDYLEYFEPSSPALQEEQEKFNLLIPRSRCPKCGHMITAIENIPVISWLFLRGKCRQCKQPISIRYPSVELLTAILTVIPAFFFKPSVALFGAIVLVWALVALSFIDFDKMLLPDEITFPILWLGIAINCYGGFVDLKESVIGAMVGYLSLWTVFWIFKIVTGKEGMGYGDFKLMAIFGAWFGYKILPATVIISACVGLVIGLVWMFAKNKGESKPFPFGPYIAIAGYIVMLYGNSINSWYLKSVLGL